MNSKRTNEEQQRAQEQAPRVKKGGKSQNSAAAALRLRLASPGYVKAAHSGRAEAVVKVVSYGRGYQARLMMDYVGRADKEEKERVELEGHDGMLYRGEGEIAGLYDEWSKKFDRAKPSMKRLPRDVAHIIFSAGADNTPQNLQRTLAAARRVAQEQFGEKGFDYVVGKHQDADKPHVHIVLNCHHRDGGKKLRLQPGDLFVLRDRFAQELRAVGLDHVSTLQRDRPKDADAIRAEIETGIKRVRQKENWLRVQLDKKAPDVNALKHRAAILDTVARINDQIKSVTKSKSPERAALMGETRKIKRALLQSEADIQKAIESTVRALAKDAVRYREQINDLVNPAPSEKAVKLSPQERASREKYLAGLEKRTTRDIAEARQAVKESAAQPDRKELALDALRLHGRLMQGVSIDKETDKLLDRLAKDVERFGADFKELRHPVSGKFAETATERLTHRRALEKQAEGIEKGIAQAQKSVQLAPVAPRVKQAALKTLQQQQQTISRSLGREKQAGR